MNLIGKIFVVAIVLMSVLFMWLAMAVYSTHKNWREAYNAVQQQYTQRNAEYSKLDSKYNTDIAELQRQIDVAQNEIANLQSDRTSLVAQRDDLATEINDLKQERRDATAAVSSTQANAERLASSNTVLQKEIITAQEAADDSFAKTVAATATLHDTEAKLNVASEMLAAVTEQVAGMAEVMRNEGLDPAMRVGDSKPRVEGYVSTIRRRAGDETIEITIGSDDGVKPEHTVEIFRSSENPSQTKYLGRAIVLSTNGDRAYARIIPELKKGQIQEGDRVATRFN